MPLPISVCLTNGLPNVVPAWVRVEATGVPTQLDFTLAPDLIAAGYCFDADDPIDVTGGGDGQFVVRPGWSATAVTLVDSDNVPGTFSYIVTLSCPTGKFIIDPQIINEA